METLIKSRKRVIIESPYGSPDPAIRERNKTYARLCLRDSLLRGEAPLASHLLYTQDGVLCDEVPEERNLGIASGLAWSAAAEYVVVYEDYGLSDGMILGIAHHAQNGLRIGYRKIL